MNVNDALNLLNLSSPVTQKEIKKAYKAQSLKFHPDRNLAGAQMMIAINAAYDTLKKLGETVTAYGDFKENDYALELNDILIKLFELDGLIIEICGNWIWIFGDTKQHAKKLGRKEGGIGCYYASKKAAWYYRPEEYKSRGGKSIPMDDIRTKYGSTAPTKSPRKHLAA